MTNNGSLDSSRARAFRTKRALFSAGCVVQILLTLEARDAIRALRQGGAPGWFFLFVAIFACDVALLVLAYAHPRRQVFLTGAVVSLFVLSISLFGGADLTTEPLTLAQVLWALGSLLQMVGFFIRPPLAPERADVPS